MAFIPPAQQGFRDRLANIFGGGANLFGNLQNSPSATPDEVERQRARAEMLNALAMGAGGQANTFIGALTQGLQGFAGGRLGRRADIQEQAGLASADEALRGNAVTAALTGRDMPQPVGAVQSPVAGAFQGAADPVMQPQGDMAESIRMGLIQRGLPEHVADAFVLNFQDESGLNPGINEQNPIVEGSRGGFGLAQWTGPRRRALEEFAASRGTPVSDLDTQLDFLMMELQGPEAGAAEAILSAPDTGSAAQAIVNRFLRPAEEHRARRAAEYAQAGGGMPTSVDPAPTQAPSNVVASILAAQQNPWVAERYGPVLDALVEQDMQRQNAAYEMQLKQSDPMYQAQLQAQQLQNQAAMNPAAPEPIEVGGVLLDPTTYQPIFDSRQPDLPSSVQEYQFAVAQDPNVGSYNDWLMRRNLASAGVGGDQGVDPKFYETLDKSRADAWVETMTAGQTAARNMGRIDRLEGLLANAPTGGWGAVKQTLGEWGVSTEGLSDLQAAQAAINSLVPEQRQPGSGPMSDADLALFKQSLPRIINQPGGNQLILETMRAIAQYDMQAGDIARRVANRELTPAQGDAEMRNLANPLEGFEARVGGGEQPETTAGAPQVGTVEDGYRFLGGNPADPNSWERVQ